MLKFLSRLVALFVLVSASSSCPVAGQEATKVVALFDVSGSMTTAQADGTTPLRMQFADFKAALLTAKVAAAPDGSLCSTQLVAVAWSTTQKVILDNNITNTEELEEAGNVIGRATGFNSQDTPHAAAIGNALTFLGEEGNREIFLTTDEPPSMGVIPLLANAKSTGVGVTLVVYRGNDIAGRWMQAFKDAGISTTGVLDLAKGSEELQEKVTEVFQRCSPLA